MSSSFNRRDFINSAACSVLGFSGITAFASAPQLIQPVNSDNINVLGPREGFTPHIGSLVSMMNWMRATMLRSVEGMGTEELDFLLDENANSIGGMLLHLAATDKLYQLLTFKNLAPQEIMDSSEFEPFQAGMELGDRGRKEIKGNNLNYYLDILEDTRNETLQELSNRDDDWLMMTDEDFPWGPTNNYCKWFHVCEHESNHNGQIKLIKSRIS